ncbi:MAG TPA: cytochrome c [Thermoanaerobaculia bacterium]
MRSILILASITLLLATAVPVTYAGDAEGAMIYASHCASCHGDDGRGTAAGKKLGVPRLSADEVQDRSDRFLRTHVAEGKDKMPAFGHKLGHEQLIDVVIHVRSFWTPKQASN